jgi:hypothetical protein
VRRQAIKQGQSDGQSDLFPFDSLGVDEFDNKVEEAESERSASEWIRWAIQRNLPKSNNDVWFGGTRPKKDQQSRSTTTTTMATEKVKEPPRMSTSTALHMHRCNPKISTWSGLAPPSTLARHRSFSLLM